jgi:signal transduction histidine kinase
MVILLTSRTRAQAGPIMSGHPPAGTDRPAGRHAQTLLDATNRFVGAGGLEELAEAVMATVATMFSPWKAALLVVDETGVARVAGQAGLSPAESETMRAALRQGSTIARRVFGGGAFWSDDPDEEGVTAQARSRLASYGAASGFSVALPSASGVHGAITAMYREPRRFDASFREPAYALAAQAGLALELVAAREDLRARTQDLGHQTRMTTALFEVSLRLATVTSVAEVPVALAGAIRAATGASLSLVGRWDEAEGRVEWLAAEGIPAAVRPRFEAFEARPDQFRMVRGGIEGRANVRVPPFDPQDVPVQLVEALGITAIAGAPIVVDGRTWGLLAVATREGDPSIVATGAELMAGLASIAASAVGRSEAVAALQHQADVLESTIAERTLQLRQAVDELRRANDAKTEFLANVSHELRTPLTAILGFSDVLLNGLDGPLSADQLEDVRTIDTSGRRLLELIDDLIDISKIESGRVELRLGSIDIRALIAGAVEEVRSLAEEKGLTLRLTAPDLPATITADEVRVREILLNLVSNAIKFTPAGGSVRVAATGEPDRIRIVVEDTGIGIAADQQVRVFDKFHRVAGPEYPGTGLGLAIAREFARLHGGDVTLESALGLGSRFTVMLPTGGPSRPATEAPP